MALLFRSMVAKKILNVNLLQTIHSLLPYRPPFLFVDEFTDLTETNAKGSYRYKEDEYFYTGHFPDQPITPGVILTETMAQIGLVGLGMFLIRAHEVQESTAFVFTSSQVDFLKPVYPGEQVFVESEKVYFRLKKLKCSVKMLNSAGEIVCQGTMSGMIIPRPS